MKNLLWLFCVFPALAFAQVQPWTGGNGTSGWCLISNGPTSAPSFQACAGGATPGGSAYSTQYYLTSSSLGGAGPGTTGQVLTSNGTSAAPTYQSGTTFPGLPSNSVVANTDLIAGYPSGGPLGSYTANQFRPDVPLPVRLQRQ